MYYFLFKHRSYEQNPQLNSQAILAVAPSAKIFDSRNSERSLIQNHFALLEEDAQYTAIEVDTKEEAEKLLLIPSRIVNTTGWYRGKLIYVFENLDFSKVENDAVMMKLTGAEAYREDEELAQKGDRLNRLNKKFGKFMSEVNYASSALSKDLYDKFVAVEEEFTTQLLAIRDARKKAKAEANRQKTNLKRKLLKFAIYKDAR